MEYKSKQVILIQAHKNMLQLHKLILYFEGKCDIFIHVDKKTEVSRKDLNELSCMPGVKGVYRKYSVHWAGFSILRCELFLLEEALKHSNGDYFHLLSGQDYPLQPLDEFLRFFHETDREGYIRSKQLPYDLFDDATFFRLKYYVLTDWLEAKPMDGKEKVLKIIKWQKKLGIKRRIPDQLERLYGGSAWFSISKRCAKYLVDYTHGHPSFFRRLKFTFYPEEVYVGTVLMNSCFAKNIENDEHLRCILWNNPGRDFSPIDLTLEHLERILKCGKMFFARKLEYPSCKTLVEVIDRYMLESPSEKTSETGCWLSRSFSSYDYDYGMSKGIIFLCETLELKTVLDLGCGPGYYVSDLQKNKIAAIGYDGNPYTEELASMIFPSDAKYTCEQADVTEELAVGHPYDMVLFLNVGEYIPEEFEGRIFKNLSVCTRRYLVINWASDQLEDRRIIHPVYEDELKDKLENHGFVFDRLATQVLRDYAYKKENKERLVVFQNRR